MRKEVFSTITASELEEWMLEEKQTILQAADNAEDDPNIYIAWTEERGITPFTAGILKDGTMVMGKNWKERYGYILWVCLFDTGSAPTESQMKSASMAVAAIANALDIPLDEEHIAASVELEQPMGNGMPSYAAEICEEAEDCINYGW